MTQQTAGAAGVMKPVRPRRRARGLIGMLAPLLFAAQPNAAEYVVTADSNMTFSPSSLTIRQGDSVRFENRGGLHNVHADDDRFVCSVDCASHNDPSSADWSVVVRFDEAGTIGYYCDEHGGTGGGMRGSITVIDRILMDGFDAPTLASDGGD